MSAAILTMSHSPLLHAVEAPADVTAEVQEAFEAARTFVREVDPQIIISFAPDHYNGFFYDTMPPFCVGLSAYGLGDYDSLTGDLDVPTEVAEDLTRAVLDEDVDVALSRAMGLDHGAVQPLEILYGALDTVPVVPVFINGVAPPFAPMRRVRALGQAVGRWAAHRDERILFIGSGGLSHDPPVPQWATAPESVRAGLLDGRNPTPEARAARQQRVIDTAREFAAGRSSIRDLAPEWDREFMRACRDHDVAAFDAYRVEEMIRDAGNSSHEVRTWVAAYAAMGAACGGPTETGAAPYRVTYEYYRPIREYIAGFGVMTATAS